MPRADGGNSTLTLFVVLFCVAFWLGVLVLVAYLK
jgi:hypothetical protein